MVFLEPFKLSQDLAYKFFKNKYYLLTNKGDFIPQREYLIINNQKYNLNIVFISRKM